MKILILPIGRIRARPIAEIAADYAKRISHYAPLQVLPCRDEPEAISNLKPGDHMVLLDAGGRQQSSEGLSRMISGHQMRGTRRMVFLIGGPGGAGELAKDRASSVLSLSPMTFPHELAQAILLEQLYRAFTILRGEPYHK
ncbi:MAG: 23S rRNA (pseudouridine(1915)-N(3))-methyltransferase RlmH [Proteobacteria bacterium]|nr:23S rRNA (pseudouridine(1915)-N(3))-methyltransferase RlmH [Pseudomonadota bacterium]